MGWMINGFNFREMKVTGGGAKKEISETSQKVIEMFGTSAAFSGVGGGVETGLHKGDSPMMTDFDEDDPLYALEEIQTTKTIYGPFPVETTEGKKFEDMQKMATPTDSKKVS